MLRSLSSGFGISGSSASSRPPREPPPEYTAADAKRPNEHVLLVQLKVQLKTALELTSKQASASWATYREQKQLNERWSLEDRWTFAWHRIQDSESRFPVFRTVLELPHVGLGPVNSEEEKRIMNRLRKVHAQRIKAWKRNTEEAIIREYIAKKTEILKGEVTDTVTVLGWRLGGGVGGRVPMFEDGLQLLEGKNFELPSTRVVLSQSGPVFKSSEYYKSKNKRKNELNCFY
ncbi:hypothetical protein QBC44DRAFT_366111 [Cladorrhinum sp. PSN332]|nr:hypothetical protein QBC44DRAFT_366111 [Cladorrhinum sp. PSN332]